MTPGTAWLTTKQYHLSTWIQPWSAKDFTSTRLCTSLLWQYNPFDSRKFKYITAAYICSLLSKKVSAEGSSVKPCGVSALMELNLANWIHSINSFIVSSVRLFETCVPCVSPSCFSSGSCHRNLCRCTSVSFNQTVQFLYFPYSCIHCLESRESLHPDMIITTEVSKHLIMLNWQCLGKSVSRKPMRGNVPSTRNQWRSAGAEAGEHEPIKVGCRFAGCSLCKVLTQLGVRGVYKKMAI